MSIIFPKTRKELQAESDAARMTFYANGGVTKTAKKKTVTTIGTGGFNFPENHEMKRPMHANGTMRPGTTIVLLLSVIGSIEVNTLDRFLTEGSTIEKSSINNLKRYIGLIAVIDGVCSLTNEGHRWLDFYALEILSKINKKDYLPTNYANSGWLKGKIRPIMKDFIKKHKKIHADWRAEHKETGITWEEYKGVTAIKDYQLVVPSYEEVSTHTNLEYVQHLAKGLWMQGIEAYVHEVPRV